MITAKLYRFETYCEVVFSDGQKFTGKKTIIEGYCKKNNIRIIETVDNRTKKTSTVFDPFSFKNWD